jgi:hypothetical protein
MAQRLSVVPPQDFDVGHNQAAALGGRGDLGQGRQVSAWKDILSDEGVDRARGIEVADRVDQRDAVLLQQVA